MSGALPDQVPATNQPSRRPVRSNTSRPRTQRSPVRAYVPQRASYAGPARSNDLPARSNTVPARSYQPSGYPGHPAAPELASKAKGRLSSVEFMAVAIAAMDFAFYPAEPELSDFLKTLTPEEVEEIYELADEHALTLSP